QRFCPRFAGRSCTARLSCSRSICSVPPGPGPGRSYSATPSARSSTTRRKRRSRPGPTRCAASSRSTRPLSRRPSRWPSGGTAAELRALAAAAPRIWIDLDCDAFDPAYLPAVQQLLPFGLVPSAFLKLLDAVWSEKVAGLSISEFDPGRDGRDASLNLLGWLI